MTNEELLYEIEHYWAGSLESGKRGWAGLAAVVKLHQPVKYKTVLHVRTGCACGAAKYPCLTIQAIEDELA